ncbi:MAG: hypothetical protein H6851_16115 [Geminicoccaceae bacterium]|nr:hypothetical protein [Geminicoccaceae bacterium]MCB9945132.1 hypothetical protein [Geminicoccaceae bacterium]
MIDFLRRNLMTPAFTVTIPHRRTVSPVTWLPVLAYHLVSWSGTHRLYAAAVDLRLPSGRSFGLGIGDILVVAAMLLLTFTAFRCGRGAVARSGPLRAGQVLLAVSAIEFLFVSGFGTAIFFMLMLAMLAEVVMLGRSAGGVPARSGPNDREGPGGSTGRETFNGEGQ